MVKLSERLLSGDFFLWSLADRPGIWLTLPAGNGRESDLRWKILQDFYAPPPEYPVEDPDLINVDLVDSHAKLGNLDGCLPLERIIEVWRENLATRVYVETRYIDADFRSTHSAFFMPFPERSIFERTLIKCWRILI
jgi:hypothetical protein